MNLFKSTLSRLRSLRIRMAKGCCHLTRRSERRMLIFTAICMGLMVIHHVSRPSALTERSLELDECVVTPSGATNNTQLRHSPSLPPIEHASKGEPEKNNTAKLKPLQVVLKRTDPASKSLSPPAGSLQNIKTSSRVIPPTPDTPQNVKTDSPPRQNRAIDKALLLALQGRAITRSKLIIIPAVIDKGYLDLAVNFFLGSIKRLNLMKHTLFMCVHKQSCEEATNMGLPTFFYEINVTETVGDFNTKAFVQKAMVKHRITRDIIAMNFSVLLCDLDMFWFKSPVEHVQQLCGDKCDFAVQREANIGLNSGFMFVKPTVGSKTFYEDLVEESLTTTKDDQTLFNTFASTHSAKGIIHHVVLPSAQYPDGSTYWTKGKRSLPPGPPCPECLVVHNNWIVSTEAKIYRFKEHLMWFHDKEGYYSDPNRKYLTYQNPLSGRFWALRPPSPPSEEYLALKSAIGLAIATNRTLILPSQFHVWKDLQPLNGVLLLRYFDHYFHDIYRESTFLANRLVPKSVKQNHCRGFRIETKFSRSQSATAGTARVLFKPTDAVNGATSSEISRWLSAYDKCNVVEFDSLYRAFKGFDNQSKNENFDNRVKLAFEHGFYDQGRIVKGPPPLQTVPII